MSKFMVVAGDVDETMVNYTNGSEMDVAVLNISGSQIDSHIRRRQNVAYASQLQRTLKYVHQEHRANLRSVNNQVEKQNKFLQHTVYCESENDPSGLRLLGDKGRESRSTQVTPRQKSVSFRGFSRQASEANLSRTTSTAVTARSLTKTPINIRMERFYETVKPLRSSVKLDDGCLLRANTTISLVSASLQKHWPQHSAL